MSSSSFSRSESKGFDTPVAGHRLWQLLYQTFVFISRSSLSILHLPPLPLALLPLPTILQVVILAITTCEAATSFLVALFGEHGATWCTALLVCCEGLCGGAAYVNAFHRLATEEGEEDECSDGGERLDSGSDGFSAKSKARKDQEKEFVRALTRPDHTRTLIDRADLGDGLALSHAANLVGRVRRHARNHLRVVPLDRARTFAVSDASGARADLLSRAVMLFLPRDQCSPPSKVLE